MTPFEYLLPLVAIVVGLALADLLSSLHRLVRARARIRWDWLPLVWAALCLLLVLQFWWDFYLDGRNAAFGTYAVFLLFFVRIIVLFLVLSAVLPDEVPDGLDLRAFHEGNTRYLFTLGAAYIVLAQAGYFVNEVVVDESLTASAFFALPTIWVELAGAAGTAGLAVTTSRRVHVWATAVLAGLFVLFLTLSLRDLG